jgi:hypothetical protein
MSVWSTKTRTAALSVRTRWRTWNHARKADAAALTKSPDSTKPPVVGQPVAAMSAEPCTDAQDAAGSLMLENRRQN